MYLVLTYRYLFMKHKCYDLKWKYSFLKYSILMYLVLTHKYLVHKCKYLFVSQDCWPQLLTKSASIHLWCPRRGGGVRLRWTHADGGVGQLHVDVQGEN